MMTVCTEAGCCRTRPPAPKLGLTTCRQPDHGRAIEPVLRPFATLIDFGHSALMHSHERGIKGMQRAPKRICRGGP